MTTIPYTWTQGRQVLAWGSPVPTPGNWYLDTNDPSYSVGVTTVYRAFPWWLALDFAYTSRRLLVLMSAPTDDGQRGRLRVYRQGEDNPPATLTDYTELESNNVSGAAIGVRGSGEVDVFYIHAGALKHRLSQDDGITFGSATTLSLASFTPNAATAAAAASQSVEAQVRGGFVDFDYLTNGGLALLVTGRLTGAVDGDQPHLVRGEWDAATDRWVFGAPGKMTSVAGYTSFPYQVQAAPDGGAWILNTGLRVRNLTWSGTFSYAAGSGGGPGAVADTAGQLLSFAGLESFPPGVLPNYKLRRLVSYRWDATNSRWALAGQAANAERFEVWSLAYKQGSDAFLTTRALQFRYRENRTWEHLFLARGEVPTIVRFPAGIPITASPLVWE